MIVFICSLFDVKRVHATITYHRTALKKARKKRLNKFGNTRQFINLFAERYETNECRRKRKIRNNRHTTTTSLLQNGRFQIKNQRLVRMCIYVCRRRALKNEFQQRATHIRANIYIRNISTRFIYVQNLVQDFYFLISYVCICDLFSNVCLILAVCFDFCSHSPI